MKVLVGCERSGVVMKYEMRDKWPEGVWDQEEDELEWEDQRTGYVCKVRRNAVGALCGYVRIPFWHEDYKKGERQMEDVYTAHGGITYVGNMENVFLDWWIGFDCAHLGDYAPGLNMPYIKALSDNARREAGRDFQLRPDEDPDNYKTMTWVIAEVERLAAQVMSRETGAMRLARKLSERFSDSDSGDSQ